MKDKHKTKERLIKELEESRQRVAELQQAETPLDDGGAHFRATFEQAAVGIACVAPDGRWLSVNQWLCDIIGYSHTELLEHGFQRITHPDDPDTDADYVDQLLANTRRAYAMEKRHVRKDGRLIWINLTVSLARDPAGDPLYFIFVIEDVTERKQAEDALHREHSLLRTLTDYMPDYIYVKDSQSRFMFTNPAHLATLGAPNLEDVIGKTDFDFFPREQAERFFADEQALLQSGQPLLNQEEVAIDHVTNRPIWVQSTKAPLRDRSGEITGLVGITRNISERKQAEETLRESEERYRSLFENMLNGFAYCRMYFDQGRPQDFIYLHVNSAFEALTGLRNVVGRKVSEVIPGIRESDRELFEVYGRVALTGQAKRFETYVSSLKMWFLISVYSPQKEYFVAVFDVITERKQAEKELHQLNEELDQRVLQRTAELQAAKEQIEAILNNSLDGILLVDPGLRIQQTNTTFNRLFACEANEYFNRSLLALVQAQEAERITGAIQTGWAQWQGQQLEVRAQRKDGAEFEAELSVGYSKTNGLVCTFRDISERKRSDAALHEQRDFLELVINSVPDLIVVKDRAGSFQLANDCIALLYGSTPADMVNKTSADFNPNLAEVSYIQQKDNEAFTTEQTVFIPEESILGRYYQTSKIPLRNREGQYDRLLIVASDVTAHKQAEEALRQAFEKEKELGDLKSRFVSMVSHEFRTPLVTILATTETLSAYRSRLTDEQIEQRLARIREQVEQLKNIMDDMLLLARMQARRAEFDPSPLDLDALCRSVIEEFQSRPDIQHRLSFTCDSPVRKARLDKKLMWRIISNLVSNAIKYSPADKPITIRLEYTSDAVVLAVRDEGIGIPEADQKRLFEAFHRGSNVGTIPGTGLGLVITKECIELHGGAIAVESQVGAGTTLTVTIPLIAEG